MFVPHATLRFTQGFLSTYLVRNPLDAWRAQQTWYSYGYVSAKAVVDAVAVRATESLIVQVGPRS